MLMRSVLAILLACSGLMSITASAQTTTTEQPAVQRTLQSDDVIYVAVVEDGSLTRETVVGADGTINLPVVGPLRVLGLTTTAVADAVRQALISADYLKNPHVSVSLRSVNRPRVAVLGMVLRPGTYEFKDGETVMHAISMAGSYDVERAKLKEATLRRRIPNQPEEQIIALDLNALFLKGDMTYNLPLKPNDVIFIPEDTVNRVYVLGKVYRPGAYVWKEHMKVLDALQAAGGTREEGTMRTVYVIRPNPKDPDSPQRITLNLLKLIDKADVKEDILLYPGDTVYFPKVNKPNWSELYNMLATIAFTRNTLLNSNFYKY